MIQRFLAVVCLCAVLLVLGGCSKRYRIEIESDTCWSATLDSSQNFTGCGNSTYKVVGPMHCVSVEKRSAVGFVRVRIDGGAWVQTTDSYGDIEACQ